MTQITVMTLDDQIGVGLLLVDYMKDELGVVLSQEQEDEIVGMAITATDDFSLGDVNLGEPA